MVVTPDFGTGKSSLGLAAWLNTTALDDLETALDGDYQAAWTVRRSAIAQDWLEAEVCRPLAAYMIENHLGLVSLKLLGTPETSADLVDSLTDGDVIGRPRWLGDFEERVNRVYTTYDVSGDERKGEPLETFEFADDELIAASRAGESTTTRSRRLALAPEAMRTCLNSLRKGALKDSGGLSRLWKR